MLGEICDNSTRSIVIENYIEGYDVHQLSEIINRSVRTIYRIVKRFEEEGTHERLPTTHCGRTPQIDSRIGMHIKALYDLNPTLYQDDCAEFMNQEFATSLSKYHQNGTAFYVRNTPYQWLNTVKNNWSFSMSLLSMRGLLPGNLDMRQSVLG
ncbi:hypothetical protein SAICODRAFT_224364 [Saitoella complicata NRRL Y-17804]|uniref:uncharacterized protein n=1 Tax=Saitoella complicata (strain BCRC 22490 / CBS 7301 / JCM 7358 / NBRC 10748 / NRRL Y-17804) TaxID=698492 RepID=UPI00086755BD|nr:uncharacterized protein SAICODRAFT_224364 [Saitoella complicata NRRL Y-17804]ODQ53753.1 hypothetical protein SAICODRAFT_224364 [Saitoella complicata NRRL Y-17804]